MSILSTVSLWMLISHVVITVVSLIIDGVLVSSDKTTITGVAVEQSWLSLLIMMWSFRYQPLWLLYISIPKNLNIEPNSKPKNTRQDVHSNCAP